MKIFWALLKTLKLIIQQKNNRTTNLYLYTNTQFNANFVTDKTDTYSTSQIDFFIFFLNRNDDQK